MVLLAIKSSAFTVLGLNGCICASSISSLISAPFAPLPPLSLAHLIGVRGRAGRPVPLKCRDAFPENIGVCLHRCVLVFKTVSFLWTKRAENLSVASEAEGVEFHNLFIQFSLLFYYSLLMWLHDFPFVVRFRPCANATQSGITRPKLKLFAGLLSLSVTHTPRSSSAAPLPPVLPSALSPSLGSSEVPHRWMIRASV